MPSPHMYAHRPSRIYRHSKHRSRCQPSPGNTQLCTCIERTAHSYIHTYSLHVMALFPLLARVNPPRARPPWAKRWRRRKEAGDALPPHQKPRAKTARKTKRLTTTAASKQHAKPDSPRKKRGTGVAEPDLREVRESASSPAVVLNPLGAAATATAAAAATATAVLQSPAAAAAAVGGEREKLDSPRARQRLEQAKELDQEVAASRGGGGG